MYYVATLPCEALAIIKNASRCLSHSGGAKWKIQGTFFANIDN